MNTQAKLIKTKVGLLNLAQYLGNVSEACKLYGYSRDTFYRYKELFENGGEQALHELSRKKPNIKNRIESELEEAAVNIALDYPAYGQLRASNELKKMGKFISPSGVRCVWLRNNLGTFQQRLKNLEKRVASEGLILTEAQVVALEKAKDEKIAEGEIETYHPGYLGAQDTYYVGTIKGVGRIYQQTFIDTYTKVAQAKVYDRKNALVAADMLNDKVIPLYDESNIPLLRILTDRGTEFCGSRENHEYQLYLALEDIDHTKTKARHPQTNGICERFHRTIQDEFYSVAFRKKIYQNLDELQTDLDLWIKDYNEERTHTGKYCYGRTPWQTWKESLHLTLEKMLDSKYQKDVNLHPTGETVTGSGGDQPARDNLSDWNGQPGQATPRFNRIIPRENAFENANPKNPILSDQV
jgi:hypothetical protein